jgi:tetratricopeptide (TPR) repeat protein
VHHAQRELRKSHLRLTPAEAAQLPRSLGITHAALGEVEGNARRCTLRYRLWKLPGKKAVGKPVTVTGTQDQVVAALPGMAKQLCRSLGVESPRVPTAPGETAEELQRLGRLPWYPTNLYLSDPQLDELLKLTRQESSSPAGEPRSPRVLAAMHATLYYGSARSAGGVERMARRLIRAAPENALVWAEVGRQADTTEKCDGRVLPPDGLAANLERCPNSYLFRTAESYFYRLSGQVEEGRRAAEHAVRCAARNPDAWLCLNAGIYDQANAIRQGRFNHRMTRQEREYCSALYEAQVPVALQAVRLDPQYARAWYKVSTTAAFQGDGELADVAFWKAVDLDPGFQPTYRWGLELYQPKWLNDPEKLEWVVRKAGEASKPWNATARLEIAFHSHVIGEHIGHEKLASLAKPLLRTQSDRAELQAALDRHHRECPKP